MIKQLETLASDLAYDYTRQPVNFGTDSEDMRVAEQDAFKAGFEAGVKAVLALAEEVSS